MKQVFVLALLGLLAACSGTPVDLTVDHGNALNQRELPADDAEAEAAQ